MKTFLLALVLIAAGCKRAGPVVIPGDSASAAASDTSPGAVSGNAPAPPAATSTTCGIEGNPVLTDEGIGELRIGQKVDEVKQRCDVVSDTTQPGSEGMKERIVAVRIGGDIVRLTIVNDKVWRIALTTSRIRTVDSLGVDTPVQRIAAMRGAQFFPGEDGVYAFVSAHCALSFRSMLPLRPPKGAQWTAATIAKEHPDAVVDRVLVTSCRG